MSDVGRTRLAACIVCRRSKIRCDWVPDQARCKRCLQLDRECVRPDVHVGRQKGIKNKRVGIDKALFQVEQAVKRSASESGRPEDAKIVTRLRELLDELNASEQLTGLTGYLGNSNPSAGQLDYEAPDAQSENLSGSDEEPDDAGSDLDSGPDLTQANEETLAIDDAENPLQLLARASYFQPPQEPKNLPPRLHHPPEQRAGRAEGRTSSSKELQEFFTPARVCLDIGDDIDPITLGLVTMEEAEATFAFFYEKLAHTRWGLDPRIYTLAYTRSRSAFLLTSIMAASALFWPSGAALSKRLSTHARSIANKVIPNRYKSVEIILAFLINVPWMFPGTHSTNDETAAYVSMANTIAIDLSLHKVLMSPEMLGPNSRLSVARGECLDPRTALAIDGFPDVDPASERGILLLRGRERCWISLFVLERGMCLARGRPFLVPITRILKDCDDWHESPLAEAQDDHLLSMAVLRRDLDGLFATVRALCDGSQIVSSDGSLVAHSIETAIEQFFDQWYTKWGASIRRGPDHRLPPYVDILVTHTRLSIYGSVINHPTAPLEVSRFFRTAGLSSALNVMRTAIHGEAQLQSMPNNTTIMISFAACFALTLSAYTAGGSTLAPSVRKLIDETAGVLERIGAVTEHRQGLSTLYGKHLRHIVRRAAKGGFKNGFKARGSTVSPSTVITQETPVPSQAMALDHHHHHPQHPQHSQQQQQALLWPETLQFSSMSDDQIMQVLNQPSNDFEPSFRGLSWDDMSNFDWLHWPEFGS